MITNKDIRVENGSLILNGDPYPLDGQSPETIMGIVEDNSDTTPTENSTAPITSGGVYTALGTKQDTLTFDTVPTENSTNPVESGGVFTALAGIEQKIDNKHFKVVSQDFTGVDISTTWGSWYVTSVLSILYSDLGLTAPPSAVLLSVKAETTTFLLMQIGSTATKTDFYLVRPNSSTGVDITVDALIIY